MGSLAFLLAVVSAVLHAIWNALLKRSRYGECCVMAAAAVQALLLVPVFVYMEGWNGFRAALPFLLASAAIHVLYRLLLVKALRTGALSQAYAIARSAPLAIALGGTFFLGQHLSLYAWLSIGVMLAGVALLHLKELAALFGIGSAHKMPWTGTLWAFLTMLSVAGYSLSDAAGVKHMEPASFYFLATLISLGFYGAAMPLIGNGRERVRSVAQSWKSEKRLIFGIAVLEPLSYILILVAFTMAPAGMVSAVRQVSVPMAALIGVLLFKEPAGLLRVAGAVLVGGGAVAMRLYG
ncbi:MAG: EamA family transporter [Planctomycetes bacterium]|nr:EamA family transporter [Planctomycetota bacterium]